MQFRYREMVYRPGFYNFHNDDRTEWFQNGIFNYNVSRLIRDLATRDLAEGDLAARDLADGAKASGIYTAVRTRVSVNEAIRHIYSWPHLEEEHVQAADLERPLIFVEISPDNFNLIDGHHRLKKASREGIEELPAWMVDAHASVSYLGSEYEYSQYVEYWNKKIEDIRDPAAYRGMYCPCPAPLQERDLDGIHIWNRMGMCINECRRIEVYSENKWFTLFRLNGKLYCGEAEEHAPSIRCQTPFQISEDMIENAVPYYEAWGDGEPLSAALRKRRIEITKVVPHAHVIMACVRVFSEY